MKVVYTTLLFILTLLAPVLGSAGDQDADFNRCTQFCTLQNCVTQSTYTMPLVLRLTYWTCHEDCKYRCMQDVTTRHIMTGQPIVQYHGKWPFWRFAGAQEPASVLFSLLNLLAHWIGGSKIKRRMPDNHPMKSFYLRWSFISINAWVWSAVFHTRGMLVRLSIFFANTINRNTDRPTTEKLDYFSAALAILYALYYTTIRIFQPSKHLRPLLNIVFIAVYVGHVSYLTLLPRFDYAYNIAFNLTLGLTNNLLWILYSSPRSLSFIHRFPSRPKSYRPKFVTKAGIFVLVTTAATALELFDFPPWRGIIDAHALWHLATAPIALLWYDFLLEDSLDPSWRDQK